ncbi:MAG: SprT protein [Flavobacteriales bacterium]|jgi:SprT protein
MHPLVISKNNVELSRFLNEHNIDYVVSLLEKFETTLKIVNPRKTKLGDCRYPRNRFSSQIIITVNNDLHPLQFLITTLHEIAHASTFRKYGHQVKSHGAEWKNEFISLFEPILDGETLVSTELHILKEFIKNPKATSGHSTSLLKYTTFKKDDGTVLLKEVSMLSQFKFQNRIFRLDKKLRTRYLCTEVKTKKQYRIHGLASVQLV